MSKRTRRDFLNNSYNEGEVDTELRRKMTLKGDDIRIGFKRDPNEEI